MMGLVFASASESAALSIAGNRASKVRLLLTDGSPHCDAIARRNVHALAVDVCEYISDRGCSVETARALCNVVTIAADLVRTPAEIGAREILARV